MLQTGGVDTSLQSSILLSSIEPSFAVWSLPWLFSCYTDLDSILACARALNMLNNLKRNNLIGLAYRHNGFRQLTNQVRAVKQPTDMSQLKIRVPVIRMYIDIFSAPRANRTAMNFGEVFVGLQQGTIDDQENHLSVIQSASLSEIQRYLTI